MRRLTLILLANSLVLTLGLPASANAQSAVNRWTPAANLNTARAGACAAVLSDGRLLVAGGLGDSGPVAAVDIYGTDGAFSAGPPMTQARARAACVTLADGRVLVTGGNDGHGSLATAEIFNTSANQWQPMGNLLQAREGHQIALTSWGLAWVAGGTSNNIVTGSMELFNPATGQFRSIGSLKTPRTEFAMTQAGRALIVAGGADGNATLSSVEIYDGAKGTITVAGAMSQARKDFAAAPLLDGTVLMTGGVDASGSTLASIEIFDPAKGMSMAGPSLLEPRAHHSAYAMSHNGSVLIYGGAGSSGVLDATELYQPWTTGMMHGSPLNTGRRDEAKAAIGAGRYMIAGGRNDQGFLSGSEIFQFATIATDKSDYAPGTAVKISGGGWVPGEQVSVTITAFPLDQHRIEFTGAAIADGTGDISVPGFAVDKSHLGLKFLMSAVGSQSQAQSTFTDGIDPIISYAFNPPNSAPDNTAVTVTVTLTPPSPSDLTPTGIIVPCTDGACPTNLTVTGCPGTLCTLSGGSGNTAVATFSITIETDPILFSVDYSGDANYNSEVMSAGPTPPGAPIVTYNAPATATTTVLTATSDDSPNPGSPQPTEIGRRITLTAVTTATGTTVQPKASAITITPPPGNTLPGASDTCGSGTTLVSSTANSVTVSCSFVLTGPFPANNPPTVTASANYLGDTGTGTTASSATLLIPVMQAITITSLTVSASPDPLTAVQLGRVVTLTARVATLSNGSGVDLGPTGSLTFTLPAVTYLNPACGTQSGNSFTVTPTAANISLTPFMSAGGNVGITTVTCTFTVLPPSPTMALGTDSISVVYNGDSLTMPLAASRGLAAQSNTAQFTTVLDGTSMAACVSTTGGLCLVSGNVYTYGQSISFSSTLISNTTLPADGAAYQPSASVTFSGSGLNFVTPIVPTTTGGTATWSVPVLPPAIGAYTVNVSYPTAKDDPYYGSSSAQVTFSVNKAATKTALQVLTVPAGTANLQVTVYNSSILGSGNPTGTVQVTNGSTTVSGILSPSASCNGLAPSCSTVTVLVPLGSNYIANYPGDSNFLASSSTPTNVTVTSPATGGTATSSIILSFAPTSPSLGTPVTITANVLGLNGGQSAPSGTVTFIDNGVQIGIASLSAGVAVLTYTPGPGSSHTIIATYSGDVAFPPATASAGLTISKFLATASSSIGGTTTVYGQPANLSVRIAPGTNQSGGPVPTGAVQFIIVNGSNIGLPVVLTNGTATLPYSGLPPGTYSIGVIYFGDNTYGSFSASIGKITVNQAQVTISLGTPATNNGQMTLTATLTVVAPGAGTPTGTVAFKDADTGATLATAIVSGGTATATIPVTGDPIVAVYSGDTNFLSATSATTITVLNAASDIAAFAADTIVSVYGSALASQTVSATLPLQSSLGGITVTVTDSAGVARPALLFFVSPGQLNLLIPAGTAPGQAIITVNTASGAVSASVNISNSVAALFTANNNGSGPLAAQVVAVAPGGRETYTDTASLSGTTYVNAPISLSPVADTFYLLLYGTGFDTAKTVTVTINGQAFTPSYSGPQGAFAGLDQVNLVLPANLAGAGQMNVSITVDGQTSNVGTIAFSASGTN